MRALTDFRDAFPSQLALALRKDSEFKELFNYHLLGLWQSGALRYY